jgi:hypothetical protein
MAANGVEDVLLLLGFLFGVIDQTTHGFADVGQVVLHDHFFQVSDVIFIEFKRFVSLGRHGFPLGSTTGLVADVNEGNEMETISSSPWRFPSWDDAGIGPIGPWNSFHPREGEFRPESDSPAETSPWREKKQGGTIESSRQPTPVPVGIGVGSL